MKIGFIDWFCEAQYPGRSGLSDLVWAMSREVVKLGHEVHIFGPYSAQPSPEIQVHKVEPSLWAYRNIIGNIVYLGVIWQQIRKTEGLELIHAVEYSSTSIFCTLGKPCPVVLTTPGNIFERIENYNHFDATVTIFYKWAARITAKKADQIIATSESMKYWWEFTRTPPEQLAIIPLGVDTNQFRPINNAKESLGLSPNPNVLFIGRLQGENQAEVLIGAFSEVIKEEPEARLDIVGDGPDRSKLKALTKRLHVDQSIRWHGSVPFDQLPLYYAAADIFVFPRVSRVTPRVLFEAMASGLPVIVSDIEGIGEFIEQARTGYLFEPHNSHQLAQIILKLVQEKDTGKEIGHNAREYARLNLDWRIITKRIDQEVYSRLVWRRRSSA